MGCLISKYDADIENLSELKDTAKGFKTSLEQALFDAEFFLKLNMKGSNFMYKNRKRIRIYGLVSSPKSQIEIFKNGKRRRTIKFTDLSSGSQLFQQYNFDSMLLFYISSQTPSITLIESSVGHILSFKIQTPNFDMDKLLFQIYDIKIGEELPEKILYNIQYNGENIVRTKEENFVTSRYAIIEGNK